ncbi:uncharacterized protein LOC134828832 [Culicoides brevitarsis]|uniref:uncharacterized protein LOC134828832 n=1 Tax=Culicoides brevitarsis TaxID=469753 RepID=UPI00307B1E26
MFFLVLKLLTFCGISSAALYAYPKSQKIIETLMPEKHWTSIRECPMRYFDNGFREEVAPLNGSPAEERDFAHMAAIGWLDEKSGNISWNCGGSLISENFVLTAAHCTQWKGRQPKVVRLGDLNLESKEGDENAQEYLVEEIFVHPNYTSRLHYNDIALLKLNASVRITTTITPACLWTFPFVKFKTLEAAGYGQTSYLGDSTPRLLKVELNSLSDDDCQQFYEKSRKLPKGIIASQFCAIDKSDRNMDLCLGDSGGPIQKKILANGRMTPFVVGVTSFGRACGNESPGVYTRVFSYAEWIENVLQTNLDPLDCAVKYAKYREFEDEIIVLKQKRKNGFWVNYDLSRAHVDVYTQNSKHRVAILGDEKEAMECGGVILTENFVLTLSDCVEGKKGLAVFLENPETAIDVKSVYQRNLKDLTADRDIALLELKTPIQFSDTVHPVCLWPDEQIPADMELEINGFGNRFYHNIYYDASDASGFGLISVRAKPFNNSDCNSENELCYGNPDLHILPNSCELDIGGALERKFYPFTYKFFPYVMGINAFGGDCGFGQPSVAVKVAKAIDWIDSIIFKKAKKEKEVNENRFKRDLPLLKAYNESHHFELEDCPHIYERYRKQSGNIFHFGDMPIYEHVAFIMDRAQYQPCHGVLITNQHVLAGYSCLYNPRNHPFDFIPELVQIRNEIRSIIDVKHHENRISLFKLNATIDLSHNIIPACLWLDKDATPFELTILRPGYDESETSYIPVRPYQNNICKHMRNDSAQNLLERENYGCLSFIYGKSSCDFEDNRVIVQAIRNISEKIVPFIVGVIDTNAECVEKKPILYTRIAYDIDWIRENI